MPMHRLFAATAGAFLATAALCPAAQAHLLVNVDQGAQRMLVSIDGQLLYVWPVSTGRPGYRTPDGSFRPMRMDINHRSEKYDNAPMPYSIFFTTTGVAVHGTDEQRDLGRPVSHGCVRLSVNHAAILWNLVEDQNMANTTVVVTGSIPSTNPPIVADARPTVRSPAPSAFAPSPTAGSGPAILAPVPSTSTPPPVANSAPMILTPASPPAVADTRTMTPVPPANVGDPAMQPLPPDNSWNGQRRGGLFAFLFGG